MPKPSKAKRQWQQKEQEESNKEYKERRRKWQKEQRKRQEEERKRRKEEGRVPSCYSDFTNNTYMSEDEWENLLKVALQQSNFKELEQLFICNLMQYSYQNSNEEGGMMKGMIKRFRELSIRFHPDKHNDNNDNMNATTNRYQIAFQALNEARGIVKAELSW